MLRHTDTLLITLALVGVACTDPAAEHAIGVPPTISAAKAGSSNPQLKFQLASSFVPSGGTVTETAAITADNTLDYTNNVCGVFAVINLATTDALLRPDADYSSRMGNCGPRYVRIRVALPSGSVTVNDGAYITIRGLGAVPPSDTVHVGFQLSTAAISATGCGYLRYGYPGDIAGTDGASITFTGLEDGKRTWEVESIGEHRPVCWPRSGSQRTLLGRMPFKITVKEL